MGGAAVAGVAVEVVGPKVVRASRVGAGVYFYRLDVEGRREAKRMVLLR